jgi:hypothetical protein
MFCVLVGGQAPSSIARIIQRYSPVSGLVMWILLVWYELALLLNMIDLFLYNREVRQYVIDRFLHRWRKFRPKRTGLPNAVAP